jgi:hypothetical protein
MLINRNNIILKYNNKYNYNQILYFVIDVIKGIIKIYIIIKKYNMKKMNMNMNMKMMMMMMMKMKMSKKMNMNKILLMMMMKMMIIIKHKIENN